MQYNQPFDQPGSPNAAFVNGNPGTGTPGSIPPAAAIEYPQREIVNVITDAGITPANGDLQQLAKAVQSGKLTYGTDTGGTVNALVVNDLLPAIASLRDGMTFIIKVGVQNTGPSTLNVGTGGVSILHVDGSTLSDGELYAGGAACFVYMTGHFQLAWSTRAAGAPTYLNASRDYYVNTSTGSDANDGLSATVTGGHGPWATLQHAQDYITKFNLNGFSINIHVANGTYAALALANMAGSGNVNWIGNSGSPSSCIISGSSKTAIYGGAGTGGNAHTFNGFKLTTTGSTGGADPGCACFFYGGGNTYIQNMDFGASLGDHIACSAGQIHVLGTINISGSPSSNTVSSGSHLATASGGIIITGTGALPTYSISSSISLPGAFAAAGELSVIDFIVNGGTFSGAGSVTGRRYQGAQNAIINTNGGGANYFPGTIAGSLSTGAQYT
jgi:hypothetical protein